MLHLLTLKGSISSMTGMEGTRSNVQAMITFSLKANSYQAPEEAADGEVDDDHS
jgi:hypothetical protein